MIPQGAGRFPCMAGGGVYVAGGVHGREMQGMEGCVAGGVWQIL